MLLYKGNCCIFRLGKNRSINCFNAASVWFALRHFKSSFLIINHDCDFRMSSQVFYLINLSRTSKSSNLIADSFTFFSFKTAETVLIMSSVRTSKTYQIPVLYVYYSIQNSQLICRCVQKSDSTLT
jgi:hypothetical protein